MKNIILACGSGIATSTAVAAKIKDLLNANGYEGEFKITTCAISEAPSAQAEQQILDFMKNN